MMRNDICKDKVNRALSEIEIFISISSLEVGDWTEQATKKVLECMKSMISQNIPINERVIRGFKDIAVISARNYEGTKLGQAINELSACLNESIPNFKDFRPLGMEFGKEDPF